MSIRSTSRHALLSTIVIGLAACGGGETTPDDETDFGGEANAGIALRSLSFSDSGNWQYKMQTQTVAEITPDSNGVTARVEYYTRSSNGSPVTWGFGPDPDAASDLFWSGTQWRTCPADYQTTLGRISGGSRQFNYCDMYATGTESVVSTDIAGQTMRSVMADIQATPGTDGFTDFASYGPVNLAVLGAAEFPAGSLRQDVIRTVDSFAPRYTNSDANQVRAYDADIAAGGDRRNGGTAPCAPDANAQLNDISFLATNLEQIIGAARGTPCIFDQLASGNSLDPHEWWGPSTVEVGEATTDSVLPAGTGTYYQERRSLRVAFTGATNVSYYECWVRRTDGSIRNCDLAGSGSYSIALSGDARVMSLSNPPASFQALGYERVLIERGSRVYAGTREIAGVQDAIGFNDPATQALLEQLLIPVPVAR